MEWGRGGERRFARVSVTARSFPEVGRRLTRSTLCRRWDLIIEFLGGRTWPRQKEAANGKVSDSRFVHGGRCQGADQGGRNGPKSRRAEGPRKPGWQA